MLRLINVSALLVLAWLNAGLGKSLLQADDQWPGKRTKWHGLDRVDFKFRDHNVTVIIPENPHEGKPWVWHGEFFGHKPAPDIALVKKGFHIVYLRVPDLLGSPIAVEHWNRLYQEMTSKYGLAKKVALVGLSRGGLYCYNWAIANPNSVACIYGDAPVCDFKSWPGGAKRVKGMKGKGSERDWKLILKTYQFENDKQAIEFRGNPVDRIEVLAKAKVPLLHVIGDADVVVPWEENTGLIVKRYRKLGGKIGLVVKKGVGHHPHGLKDSSIIVDFISNNSVLQFNK